MGNPLTGIDLAISVFSPCSAKLLKKIETALICRESRKGKDNRIHFDKVLIERRGQLSVPNGVTITYPSDKCKARSLSASAASCTASDRVGRACMVLAKSSLLAENSIASTASAISSEACVPMM